MSQDLPAQRRRAILDLVARREYPMAAVHLMLTQALHACERLRR